MKRATPTNILARCLCLLLPWLAAACTHEDGWAPAARVPGAPVDTPVDLCVTTAAMKWAGSAPSGRAVIPMAPEQENILRSLAVFQFDREGLLRPISQGSDQQDIHAYYHYIDLITEDNPIGVLSTTMKGINLQTHDTDTTRVCLVANLSEEQIADLLYYEEKKRRLMWLEFQGEKVDIQYKLPVAGEVMPEVRRDSVGHVHNIFMFGYFEGILPTPAADEPIRELSVSLGRIIARLEVNISLGEGYDQVPPGYRICFGMRNVERSAYLFPRRVQAVSQHQDVNIPTTERTEAINAGEGQFYFYAAPHIVHYDPAWGTTRDEIAASSKATRFLIWCLPEDEFKRYEGNLNDLPDATAYKVLMCNDALAERPAVPEALWINRNSIYHANLVLTGKDVQTSAARSDAADTYAVPILP